MSSGKTIWVIECNDGPGWEYLDVRKSEEEAQDAVDYLMSTAGRYSYRAWPYVPKEQK